jgi:hypothetical protein
MSRVVKALLMATQLGPDCLLFGDDQRRLARKDNL